MLYYDRTDISKGIGLAKCNKSREFMICHYVDYRCIMYLMLLLTNTNLNKYIT